MSDEATAVQTITIATSDDSGIPRSRTIEAEIHGPWAIHPSTLRDGGTCGHSVTHIATGTAYAIGCDLPQARAVVAALQEVPGVEAIDSIPDARRWHEAERRRLVAINREHGIAFDQETCQQYGSEAVAYLGTEAGDE